MKHANAGRQPGIWNLSHRPGPGKTTTYPDSGKWEIEPQAKVFGMTGVDYLQWRRMI
ncbi:MAG: hypothetical protein ACREDQ_06230 [Limisphaerales bacterium]